VAVVSLLDHSQPDVFYDMSQKSVASVFFYTLKQLEIQGWHFTRVKLVLPSPVG